jgi:hypothetical protein
MNVRFFGGTKAQYLSLQTPRNPLGLYFCEDTHELFWGDRLISDGIRVIPTKADLPELSSAADGVVYYVTETRNGYALSPDRTQWLQTIYAPATDAYEVPEDEIYNTVTTVGAVRDIEAKIYKTIDEKFVIPDIDLSNYYNKTEVTEAIASASSEKADKVLFKTDKFVNNPIGSFNIGDNIKDLTVSELITRLLGLTDTFGNEDPDDPEVPQKVTIEIAKQKFIPVLQGDVKTGDGSTVIDDTKSVFDYFEISEENKSAAPTAAKPGTSAIYEIINDAQEVTEHGYLVYTIASGRGTYWRVSLAEGLVIKEIKMFDDLQGQWVEYTPTLTDTGERLDVDGYTFVVYQSSDRSNGEVLRLIV